jgi:3-deoxy-D-manno-octulosonic-acid transferase
MRDRGYITGFRERLGFLHIPRKPTPAGAIWLHAVSVGEVISSIPLLREIRERYAPAPLFVSCSTLAGRAIADVQLPGLADGVFYAPLDYRSCVRRVIRRLRPSLVIVLETEIWPNLYREVKRSGAALMIANGRISDRALPRYRPLRWFFGPVLSCSDRILVQSERDRDRYREIGAPEQTLITAGNLKYDFTPAAGGIPADVAKFLHGAQPREIWIAASTMPAAYPGDVEEDDVVIEAFNNLRDRQGLLLIHVPRKPERFDAAASKLRQAGVPFVRRTALDGTSTVELPGVLLLDSMGELSRMFPAADVVFMGGTLARRGGHNVLEPAAFGKAVVAGPHMENFDAIAREFDEASAWVRIGSAAELSRAVRQLLDSPSERAALGERARRLAESKRGVTARIADVALELYFTALPGATRSAWRAPLAALWKAGVRRDRRRGLAARSSLAKPVISIGGITMGGAGKTPFADWLSARLREAGLTPAILTRGYRRRSVQKNIVIPAGSICTPALTGDEAQIFVRSAVAHVGIGSDRYETGRLLDAHVGADVFILDDGFQHWRLARNLDVVLIDALDPFGGGAVFPQGRLREPLDGLSRAHAFVITRVEPGIRMDAVEAVLRRYNERAPVFRARVAPQGWCDLTCSAVTPPRTADFRRVGAFCGLANPATFWRTLDNLGFEVVLQWAFSDHHRYETAELKRLTAAALESGAEALVTTEKDAINLCDGAAEIAGGMPLYWLKIAIEMEDAAGFMDFVSAAAGLRRTGPASFR